MRDNIKYWVGLYGEIIGILLIVLVSTWDLFKWGILRFLEYKICWGGIAIIWLGVFLIVASKHWQESF